MATVNYRIKGKANPANIKIRFKQGDQFDVELATGLKTRKEHWNSKQQKVRLIAEATYKDEVNNHLNLLKAFIEKEYLKISSSNVIINSNWLKNRLDEYFGRCKKRETIYLTEFVDSIVDDETEKRRKKLQKTISESTLDNYRVLKNKILAFESFIKNKVKLEEINLEFHGNFIEYLSQEELLSNSTIAFYIGKLKTICRKLISDGYQIPLDFKSSDFYTPIEEETVDVYLNEEEIKKVFDVQYEFDSKLDNARDWFVIGLWTGLRVSDLLNLTEVNIVDEDIIVKNQKTNIPVLIPIHPQIATLLDTRLGNFPRKISDVKFNKYIKQVGKDAGLTDIVDGYKMMPVINNGEKIYRKKIGKYPKYELLSSHCCRRSVASNYYGKLSNLTIMQLTGHKTEQNFLKYIKITPKQHAQKFRELWENNS